MAKKKKSAASAPTITVEDDVAMDYMYKAISLPPAGEKPQWPLSSWSSAAWSASRECCVAGLDVSPEELHLKAKGAALRNVMEAYLECEATCFWEAQKIYRDMRQNMGLTKSKLLRGDVYDGKAAIGPALVRFQEILGRSEECDTGSSGNEESGLVQFLETLADPEELDAGTDSSRSEAPESASSNAETLKQDDEYMQPSDDAAVPSTAPLDVALAHLSPVPKLNVATMDAPETTPETSGDAPASSSSRVSAAVVSSNIRHSLGNDMAFSDKDAVTCVLGLLNSFCGHVRDYCDGTVDMGHLVQANYGYYATFAHDVRATAPNFVPFANSSQAWSAGYEDVNHSDEETSETPLCSDPRYLPDIRSHIDRARTRELPGNVPYSAKMELILDFQVSWHALASKCFASVHTSVHRILRDLIRSELGCFSQLGRQLDAALAEILALKNASCNQRMADVLQLDAQPFTQNKLRVQRCKEQFLSKYKAARQKIDVGNLPPATNSASRPWSPPVASLDGCIIVREDYEDADSTNSLSDVQKNQGDAVDDALGMLERLGFAGLTSDDLDRAFVKDDYEDGLETMAEVRAYFQIAYERIIDNVPNVIETFYTRAIGQDLQSFLLERLHVTGADALAQCTAYLEDHQGK